MVFHTCTVQSVKFADVVRSLADRALPLQEVFSGVCYSTVEEDINRVLFGTNKGTELDPGFGSRSHLKKALGSRVPGAAIEDLADRVSGVRLENLQK